MSTLDKLICTNEKLINIVILDYTDIRVVIHTSSKCKFRMRSPEQELSLKDENGDLIDLTCNVAEALMQ